LIGKATDNVEAEDVGGNPVIDLGGDKEVTGAGRGKKIRRVG
jgi:hypothetical protein